MLGIGLGVLGIATAGVLGYSVFGNKEPKQTASNDDISLRSSSMFSLLSDDSGDSRNSDSTNSYEYMKQDLNKVPGSSLDSTVVRRNQSGGKKSRKKRKTRRLKKHKRT